MALVSDTPYNKDHGNDNTLLAKSGICDESISEQIPLIKAKMHIKHQYLKLLKEERPRLLKELTSEQSSIRHRIQDVYRTRGTCVESHIIHDHPCYVVYQRRKFMLKNLNNTLERRSNLINAKIMERKSELDGILKRIPPINIKLEEDQIISKTQEKLMQISILDVKFETSQHIKRNLKGILEVLKDENKSFPLIYEELKEKHGTITHELKEYHRVLDRALQETFRIRADIQAANKQKLNVSIYSKAIHNNKHVLAHLLHWFQILNKDQRSSSENYSLEEAKQEFFRLPIKTPVHKNFNRPFLYSALIRWKNQSGKHAKAFEIITRMTKVKKEVTLKLYREEYVLTKVILTSMSLQHRSTDTLEDIYDLCTKSEANKNLKLNKLIVKRKFNPFASYYHYLIFLGIISCKVELFYRTQLGNDVEKHPLREETLLDHLAVTQIGYRLRKNLYNMMIASRVASFGAKTNAQLDVLIRMRQKQKLQLTGGYLAVTNTDGPFDTNTESEQEMSSNFYGKLRHVNLLSIITKCVCLEKEGTIIIVNRGMKLKSSINGIMECSCFVERCLFDIYRYEEKMEFNVNLKTLHHFLKLMSKQIRESEDENNFIELKLIRDDCFLYLDYNSSDCTLSEKIVLLSSRNNEILRNYPLTFIPSNRTITQQSVMVTVLQQMENNENKLILDNMIFGKICRFLACHLTNSSTIQIRFDAQLNEVSFELENNSYEYSVTIDGNENGMNQNFIRMRRSTIFSYHGKKISMLKRFNPYVSRLSIRQNVMDGILIFQYLFNDQLMSGQSLQSAYIQLFVLPINSDF
ncbi:hypothetical protein SNEBB_004215 [Seison nebaliae]|nr:hypothetical protein SNEBB_004215 [Seison nebaliae]